METITGILPLQSDVRNRACSTLFRLHGHQKLNIVRNSRTKLKPHSASFCDILNPDISYWDIQRLVYFKPPTFNPVIADEDLMKELISSHQTVIDRYHFSCFTDGSKINEQTGAALVVYTRFNREPLSSFNWRLHDRNSVFQAEMMAINEACTFLTSLPSEGSSVAIFTDSLSSVYALSAASSTSRLCIETRSSLDNLASTCGSVFFSWIRGHAGVQGNDLADAGAKKGALCYRLKVVPLPRRYFKSSLLTSSFTRKQDSLSSSDSSTPSSLL